MFKNQKCDKIIDNILFSCGIIVDSEAKNALIPMDSITFVSLIVEIENCYSLTVPNELLIYKEWDTYEKIENNISQLCLNKGSLHN